MFIGEERIEKRRSHRVRFSEPVQYRIKDSARTGGCLACDIGEGGMKLNLEEFIPINSEISLHAKLKDSPRAVDVVGRVAWLQQIPYSDRYHVGIQFNKADPLLQNEIRNYVNVRRF